MKVGTSHQLTAAAALLFALTSTHLHAGDGEQRAATASAPGALTARVSVGQYRHEVWQREQGLPQNAVTALAQTPDGYLWLGTEEGLVRFDGTRFTVYDRQSTPAFLSNDVTALFADRGGTLWIGTNGGGLLALAGGRFRRFDRQHGLESDAVSALHQDEEGRIWIGTAAGLHTLEAERVRRAVPGAIAVTSITSEGDTIWAATNRGLLRIVRGRTERLTDAHGLASTDVRVVQKARTGGVWVGTRAGLQRFDGRSWRTWSSAHGLPSDLIVAVLEEPSGVTWAGTRGGGVVRIEGDRVEVFGTADGLSHEDVMALFVGREGHVWIGTNNGGLNRLSPPRLVTLGTRQGLSHDIVLPIAADAAGTIWTGTYGGGLNRIDAQGVSAIRRTHGLSADVVLSLWPARDGSLFVGTRAGIDRVVDGRVQRVLPDGGANVEAVHALYEDRDGVLWAGTRRGLLRVQGGRATRVGAEEGWEYAFVSAIVQDATGAIWIGTQGDGIRRLAGGRSDAYSVNEGLPSDVVWSLNIDAAGAVWAGTSAGIARFDSGRFRPYTPDHGLPSGSIFQVLDDERGSLWLASNKGLFRIARADFDAVDRGRARRVSARGFDETDGMKSRECNGGFQPAGWRAGGRLLFPTIKGLVLVDPLTASRALPAPRAVIERVFANGREFDPRAPLVVAPGAGSLDVRYTAPTFTAPGKVRFRYRLDGFDGAWVDADDRRSAMYTNLRPGTYTFRVMAADQDGTWGAVATTALQLQPHFHQTGAFSALLAVGLVSLVLGAHRLRVRSLRVRERRLAAEAEMREQLLRLEREARAAAEAADRLKDDFLATLSHELRTPLNAILGWTQLLRARRDSPDAIDRGLAVIERNAVAQARLVEDILEMSALSTGNLRLHVEDVDPAALVHEAMESARPAAAAKGLDMHATVAPGLPALRADPQRVHQILCNLLLNAVKFTESGSIVVRALPASDGVTLEVSDTGIGISPELLPHVFERFRQGDASTTRAHMGLGLGLALVKDLAELHGGSVEVFSEGVSRGATFRVHLPAASAESPRGEAAAT